MDHKPENYEALQIEIYEAKVRDLTEKLIRCKEKCDMLTKENDALGKAQAKFSSDKQDIVEFLNIKVREHEEHITALEDKVRRQEEEIKEMEIQSKTEMETLKNDSQHELEQAQNQSSRYKAELDQLFDFKGRKDELEFQLKRTMMLLDTREKEYKDIIHSMERKVLQDKNQMKKEMLQKVNEAVANFRRVADQQMAETTKRAIRENMAITSQLKKMSAKTIDLLAENQSLTAKVGKFKISNSLLIESESELAKKNQANQRVIKMLVDRLKESDEMLEVAYDASKDEEKQVELPEFDGYTDLKFKLNNEAAESLSEVSSSGETDESYSIMRQRLNEYEAFLKELDAMFCKVSSTGIETGEGVDINTMRKRFVAAFESFEVSKDQVLISDDNRKAQQPSIVKGIKHKVDRGLAPVISAIPSSRQDIDPLNMLPRSIGVQTLPVFFGIANGAMAESPQTVLSLLSDVRPWGPPAMCIPKKGTKRVLLPRHLPSVIAAPK